MLIPVTFSFSLFIALPDILLIPQTQTWSCSTRTIYCLVPSPCTTMKSISISLPPQTTRVIVQFCQPHCPDTKHTWRCGGHDQPCLRTSNETGKKWTTRSPWEFKSATLFSRHSRPFMGNFYRFMIGFFNPDKLDFTRSKPAAVCWCICLSSDVRRCRANQVYFDMSRSLSDSPSPLKPVRSSLLPAQLLAHKKRYRPRALLPKKFASVLTSVQPSSPTGLST